MGDGGTIFNLWQESLDLSDDSGKSMRSVFQPAAVTRPLMSVGRMCDEGRNITFDEVMAVVKDTNGTETRRFQLQQGGLRVAKIKLRHPMGFARLECAMGDRTVRRH